MMCGTARDGDLQSQLASIEAESVDSIWVASVAAEEVNDKLAAGLRKLWGRDAWFAATAERMNGLVNSYAHPERMGVDRWLAMLGAKARCSDRFCVVDVGSALTIDLVGADGVHEGGYILPGPRLMSESLNQNTARVRYSGFPKLGASPGTDTATAVSNGIALALSGAIEQAVRHSQRSGPRPEVVITGGAGKAVQGLLQCTAQYVEDLVFEGLEIAIGAR